MLTYFLIKNYLTKRSISKTLKKQLNRGIAGKRVKRENALAFKAGIEEFREITKKRQYIN